MNTVASEPHRSAGPSLIELICRSGSAAESDSQSSDPGSGDRSDSQCEPDSAGLPALGSSAQGEGKLTAVSVAAPISDALVPLREVVASLAGARAGHFPDGRDRQRLLRRARQAGQAVLPCLLRALGSDSSAEAAWAHCLLRAVAAVNEPAHEHENDKPAVKSAAKPLRERVLERLNQSLGSPRIADAVKARAMALLADLGAPLCDQVTLRDPDALLADSVRELLSNLESAADISEALDLIFTQVPAAELQVFVDEIGRYGGALARPLIAALIADRRLPPALAHHLMAQYRPARLPPQLAPRRRPRSMRERLGARLGPALALLSEGKLLKARDRLARLLPEFSDQPAVHSALGLCLLRLGEPQSALAPLQRALELEPTVAAHAWNLAAAAHAARQPRTCYRSLRCYLEQRDDSDGAAGRRGTAEAFCQSYEQSAVPAEPQLAPVLARAGEE